MHRIRCLQENLRDLSCPLSLRLFHNFLRLCIVICAVCSSVVTSCLWWRDFGGTTQRIFSLIDNYRRGPQNQDHGSFLLWRLTFPIFALLVCCGMMLFGQFGILAYCLVSCPIWFSSHLYLVIFPFWLLYHYRKDSETTRRYFWNGLCVVSLAISGVEAFFTLSYKKMSWIVGNTLFGVVAFVIIPFYFFVQDRYIRVEDITCFVPMNTNRLNNDSIETNTASLTSIAVLGVKDSEYDSASSSSTTKWIHDPTTLNQKTHVIWISIGMTCIAFLVTWATYLSPKSYQVSSSPYWWLLVAAIPLFSLVLYLDKNKTMRYNFSYLIFYVVTVSRIPDFLGHLTLDLFSMAEITAGEQAPGWLPWVKFGISAAFLVIMHGYFRILMWVVQNMSEPLAHPTLLYIGQLYYYMFWYILVGNDAPFDKLYGGMLLLNNIHIVLTNTGLYTDLRHWHALNNIRLPLALCIRNSGSVCYFPTNKFPQCKTDSHAQPLDETSRETTIESDHHGDEMDENKNTENKKENEERKNMLYRFELKSLYFLMKMAEQDNMADTTALVLIPTLFTLLAIADSDQSFSEVLAGKVNLWLRCICMFIARICSARLSREIFAYKLRSQTRKEAEFPDGSYPNEAYPNGANDLYVQSIMVQDFQKLFWYFSFVTLVCTFTCFERLEWPTRYAFLTRN